MSPTLGLAFFAFLVAALSSQHRSSRMVNHDNSAPDRSWSAMPRPPGPSLCGELIRAPGKIEGTILGHPGPRMLPRLVGHYRGHPRIPAEPNRLASRAAHLSRVPERPSTSAVPQQT